MSTIELTGLAITTYGLAVAALIVANQFLAERYGQALPPKWFRL